ncbi:hypothetical protein ACFY04_36610 [Streptomyces sp. NPDC001549]|uniref:hypothetical protein n=1 Tax=Streptomyces sp. NPDC001549 TaxID=3364586 RepID=UPI0036976DA0
MSQGHERHREGTAGRGERSPGPTVFGYGYRDFGDFGDHVITEDADPFAPAGDRAVERHLEGMRVKAELTLGAYGIEGIALRFGLFYGAGGTEALVAGNRPGRPPLNIRVRE